MSARDSAGWDKRQKYLNPAFESSSITTSRRPTAQKKGPLLWEAGLFYFFILKN